MARGRHRRRSGLLARLRLTIGPARRRGRHEVELGRVRAVAEATAATACAALVRAAAADDRARSAELRAASAEHHLVGLHAELAGLRSELTALREELVWAFAEARTPVAPAPAVIDLRDDAVRPA